MKGNDSVVEPLPFILEGNDSGIEQLPFLAKSNVFGIYSSDIFPKPVCIVVESLVLGAKGAIGVDKTAGTLSKQKGFRPQ